MFYADLQCPQCALAWDRVGDTDLNLGLRHFPVTSAHSRAFELACATEAAARQGAFWEMVDSILRDQGRIDDPHLWSRVSELNLDLDRFETDRRADTVAERVRKDFRDAVRAGVATTPTFLVDGILEPGVPDSGALARWRA